MKTLEKLRKNAGWCSWRKCHFSPSIILNQVLMSSWELYPSKRAFQRIFICVNPTNEDSGKCVSRRSWMLKTLKVTRDRVKWLEIEWIDSISTQLHSTLTTLWRFTRDRVTWLDVEWLHSTSIENPVGRDAFWRIRIGRRLLTHEGQDLLSYFINLYP